MHRIWVLHSSSTICRILHS